MGSTWWFGERWEGVENYWERPGSILQRVGVIERKCVNFRGILADGDLDGDSPPFPRVQPLK